MADESVGSPEEIWRRVFDIVRRNIDVPTVWLAMQAVKPLAIEGANFIAGLPADMSYLSVNLESNESATEIEAALAGIIGRPMMFTLIEGETIEDWKAVKAVSGDPLSTSVIQRSHETHTATTPPSGRHTEDNLVFDKSDIQERPQREGGVSNSQVLHSWDSTYECIHLAFKRNTLVRYPHGQSYFLLNAIPVMADTIEHLMPQNDPADLVNQRGLQKLIEKVAAMLTLDPFFVALEITRYRQSHGKDFEDYTLGYRPKAH